MCPMCAYLAKYMWPNTNWILDWLYGRTLIFFPIGHSWYCTKNSDPLDQFPHCPIYKK